MRSLSFLLLVLLVGVTCLVIGQDRIGSDIGPGPIKISRIDDILRFQQSWRDAYVKPNAITTVTVYNPGYIQSPFSEAWTVEIKHGASSFRLDCTDKAQADRVVEALVKPESQPSGEL